MIERLFEKSDYNKFFEDTKSRDIFLELLKRQEYLELVEDKTLLLGCREKEGVEVLQVQDANLLNFFRLVRDDFHCWKELVSIRRSAHKQLLQSFLKNAFYNSLQEKLEKSVLGDSTKLCKKIHTVHNRMENLHQRLQGVFLVGNKRKEIITGMDSLKTVIVYKKNDETTMDLSWGKDLKYACAFVLAPEDKNLHKDLKKAGFDKLQLGRKKSKNIWAKNHK